MAEHQRQPMEATGPVADALRKMGVVFGLAASQVGRAWRELSRTLEAACIRERGKLPGSHRTSRLRKKRRKAIERILADD